MFESIIDQKVVKRMLLNEIDRGTLPQTLLFYGPEGSGKFLTALEIARITNCERNGADNCFCDSCRRIRSLNSPNMQIISKSNLENSFEIWFRYGVDEYSFPFFYRDIMRLILQVKSKIVMQMKSQKKSEDKIEAKINDEISFLRESTISFKNFINSNKEKIFDEIKRLLNAVKNNIIPIDEIRDIKKFLYHTAGSFKKKIVIIDGVEYMNEEASNSFLKISEDTPENSLIIMTAINKKAIKDTIVSRARNYRFIALNKGKMKEVLHRLYNRDIFYEEDLNFDSNLSDILNSILKNRRNYDEIFNIVQDIIKNGKEIEIINYIQNLLREKMLAKEKMSIEEVYDFESKLKDLEDEKRKLKSTNVNRELSFTNFLIKSLIN